MFSLENFNKFHLLLKDNINNFEIKYKNESRFMWILSKILFFNDFNKFVTTINSTVYFPSKESVSENIRESFAILAHEYVHAKDAKKINFLIFSFLYLFPQILFLPTIIFSIYFHYLFILCFILLLPIPAYFRMIFERRGYIMTLYMLNEFLKKTSVSKEKRKQILYAKAEFIDNNYFKGWSYYKMWPPGILNYLKLKIDDMLEEQILDYKCFYFKEVQEAFDKSTL